MARAQGRVPTHPVSRRRWYYLAFAALLAAYAALTVIVMVGSPLDQLDANIVGLRIRAHHPGWNGLISVLVITGQRGPSTLVALPWFVWRAWRQRSLRPLVLLGTALLVLNVTVGAVKIGTGRLGPRHSHVAHEVFTGGMIFPSGHVSNAVVLFGLLAWIAVRHRKKMIALAVAAPVMVGACTIYLKTHWLSDIVGAWMAGALVLMVLPWVMPAAERGTAAALQWLSRLARPRRLAVLAGELSAWAAPVPPVGELPVARPGDAVGVPAVSRAVPCQRPDAPRHRRPAPVPRYPAAAGLSPEPARGAAQGH